MKKRILTSMTLVALMATVGFVSCTKEDPAEDLNKLTPSQVLDIVNADTQAINAAIAKLGTATIEGYVLILDDVKDSLTNVHHPYAVPSPVNIIVTIPYANLYDTTGTGYRIDPKNPNWTTNITSLGSDGKFTLTVPATQNGVTATFKIDDIIDNSYIDKWQRGSQGQDSLSPSKKGYWASLDGLYNQVIPTIRISKGQKMFIPGEKWVLKFVEIKESGDYSAK